MIQPSYLHSLGIIDTHTRLDASRVPSKQPYAESVDELWMHATDQAIMGSGELYSESSVSGEEPTHDAGQFTFFTSAAGNARVATCPGTMGEPGRFTYRDENFPPLQPPPLIHTGLADIPAEHIPAPSTTVVTRRKRPSVRIAPKHPYSVKGGGEPGAQYRYLWRKRNLLKGLQEAVRFASDKTPGTQPEILSDAADLI